MQNYEEPLFLISVVAKVLSIHPQTLRQYEREGLVEPSRTDGKMRLYSQKDEATSQTSTKRSLVKRKSSFDLVFYEGKK